MAQNFPWLLDFLAVDGLIQFAWLLPPLARGAAAVRVLSGDEPRRHSFLVAMALTLIVTETIGNLGHDSFSKKAYFRFWLGAVLAIYSLVALAMTEACTRSVESYVRFGEVGRRIIRFILVASGLSILGFVVAVPDSLTWHYLEYIQAQTYIAQGSLALLGLSMLTFAKWAHLKLRPNSRLTIIGLTALCGMDALLGAGIAAEWPSLTAYFGIGWSTACWSFLALRWSSLPEGAKFEGRDMELAKIAPALAQMEAMNRQLAELMRRG